MDTISFVINGRRHTVPPEHKNTTLLVYLREVLQLSGTKCGCNTGNCGTCKVLVDGEAVTSCVLPLRKLDGKCVLTIEGLCPAPEKVEDLHPLQQAFIKAGAVQCGFCTPGMILTAKALLDKNPRPTRHEAAQAFAGNLCRCTGYVKILDAVLAAAAVMRGEPDPLDARPLSATGTDADSEVWP